MKNLITLVVFRLVVFVSLFCLFLLAFWGIQGYFKSNGNAKLEANSVDAIYNISASGIVAYLCDHYFFPANEITFADEVEFCDDSSYGSIQYQDDNGNWIDANALQLRPIQNAGRIVMTSIPGRVDYTIGMACINSPEDTLSFPCSMQYSFISEHSQLRPVQYLQSASETSVDRMFCHSILHQCTIAIWDADFLAPTLQ